MKYRVVIEQDEDGVFVVECPSLSGCILQGNTRQEALENIQEAMEGNWKASDTTTGRFRRQ